MCGGEGGLPHRPVHVPPTHPHTHTKTTPQVCNEALEPQGVVTLTDILGKLVPARAA